MTTPPDAKPPSERRLWEYRWVRDLLWILGALALIWVVYSVRAIAAPVLVGLAMAYAVNPIVNWLTRKLRISRMIATSSILLVAFVLFLGLMAYLVPLLFYQTTDLIDKAPEYAKKAAARAAPALNDAGVHAKEQFEKILSIIGVQPHDAAETQPGDGAAAEKIADDAIDSVIAESPRTMPATRPAAKTQFEIPPVDWAKVGAVLLASVNVGWNVVGSTISTTAYIGLAFVLTFYCFFVFSWKFDAILAWFGTFIPHAHRERTVGILARMDNAVSSFLRGRMIQVVVLGTNLSLGWWIVGVPYWALLGMLSGLMNIVPYASFIGWPIAVLLIWVDTVASGGQVTIWKVVVWPSLAYILPQQFDNWIVEPLVQGKATSMDPLSVMLAVMIGASLLGVVGMIIAIPCAACIKIIAQEMIIPQLRARAEKS